MANANVTSSAVAAVPTPATIHTFYADPYDPSSLGFHFSSIKEFKEKLSEARNPQGFPLQDFDLSIEYVGDHLGDLELFESCWDKSTDTTQLITLWFEVIQGMTDQDKALLSMITSMEPFRDRFIGATLGSVYWSHPGIGLMEPPQDRPNGATRHRFFPSN